MTGQVRQLLVNDSLDASFACVWHGMLWGCKSESVAAMFEADGLKSLSTFVRECFLT
jgi:hypothetical protein